MSWSAWLLSLVLCVTITWQLHHLQIESVKFIYPNIYYLIEASLFSGALFSYGAFTGLTLWLDGKFRPYPVYSILAWTVFMLAFAGISARFNCPDLLDQAGMYVRAITDPYDLRKSQLHLTRDGSAVEVEGVIDYGLTGALAHMLDAHSAIKTVTFKSPGGVAAEGIWMGKMIRARGLDTYADAYCVSSCAFAFAGGVHRRISDTAVLGFHRPSIIASPREYNKIVVFMREYLIACGIAPEFVQEALGQGFRHPWFPEHARLLAGRVID